MNDHDTADACNGHQVLAADKPAGGYANLTAGYADPVVSGEPVEVSEGVFVIADNRVPLVPNVGIVVGEHAVLVIDTGIGPGNGAVVLDQARRLAGTRKLYLAITQLDPGHGFGAQAFKRVATIVYSDAQRYRLRRHARAYVHTFQAISPVVAARLDGLELVDCDVCYDRRLDIDLGGTRAVLRQWGPAHTTDDQTVLIDNRVLFGGDLFETRLFPILPYFPPFDSGFDGRRWLDTLDRLIACRPDIVVPGHGEITDVGQIVTVRDYLHYLFEQTGQLRRDGASAAEAAVTIAKQAQLNWATWEGPRNIRYAVRAFYDQLEREQ
jgi:glyoxylase-like metal-dependent hydrolase (beta-lactamase superfamily II)